jgi:uncharacterized protein (TIGR03083 family)
MPLKSPVPIDTRPLFRPVSSSLVVVLHDLSPEQWNAPTVAGHWVVRDIVAHLLDTTLRRLSFHRDAMPPPPPPHAITSDRDFVAFINGINAQWVASSKRLSPRVLTDLYQRASGELSEWFESVPFDAPALFPVSWAGEQSSTGWFDIGREFTELWHHQEQIRMAVGEESLADPRYLRAVIDVAVRGLPHAFRDVPADVGHTVAIDVSGASGGQWTLRRDPERWALWCGIAPSATARVHMDDQAAWKLLFNALSERDAGRAVQIEGNRDLGQALFQARSIVV